jgi:putative IMPACT (imprinted ancient) family translation regulator
MLGAGGLVRAYSHSASIAVAAGGIVTRAMCARLKVTCDYYFYGKMTSLVPEAGGIIEDTIFEDNVTLIFRLPLDLVDSFNANLVDVSNGRYKAEKTDEFFADVD